MQKLNTLSERGVCLVVIGCLAYAGGKRCTVRNSFFNSLKIRLRTQKRHFSSIPPFCHYILWILSVFRNACCFLEALPLWTF